MIEISGRTKTRAQFLARARAALRAQGEKYGSWADAIDTARDDMDEVAAGKREPHYGHHTPDAERNFTETYKVTAEEYQLYYKDDETHYNFILEWADGCGYFYCIDDYAEKCRNRA